MAALHTIQILTCLSDSEIINFLNNVVEFGVMHVEAIKLLDSHQFFVIVVLHGVLLGDFVHHLLNCIGNKFLEQVHEFFLGIFFVAFCLVLPITFALASGLWFFIVSFCLLD